MLLAATPASLEHPGEAGVGCGYAAGVRGERWEGVAAVAAERRSRVTNYRPETEWRGPRTRRAGPEVIPG